MDSLLGVSRLIDRVNEIAGRFATMTVIIATLVCVINALLRYGLNLGSNAWLEAQAMLFGAMIYLGGAATLRVNEHIRIDIVYTSLGERGRLWVDVLGLVTMLIPVCALMAWLSWRFAFDSYVGHEVSANAGGLPVWPSKIFIPIGFGLLTLQGVSELIKRIAALRGRFDLDTGYEKPAQ